MTTATAHDISLAPLGTDPALLADIASRAAAVDKGELDARYILPLLGDAQLFRTDLLTSARLIRELSRNDLSVGFTTWAHRMTLEYLRRAGTAGALGIAKELETGTRPGVTGMAAAFKEFAGCGEIELHAVAVDAGYRISGKLNWASNLYEDAVLVSAARTGDGERVLFVVEGSQQGVTFGSPFGLLGLNATASAWVELEDVFVPEGQILTHDFDSFIKGVRPVFVVLQIAECLGVAEAAVAAASTRLTGVNATFAEDVDAAFRDIEYIAARQEDIIARIGVEEISPVELLELRLDAAAAAVAASGIEVRVAGGAGYAKNSPASRRFREASFIPVQSPSESQLRWELARARGNKA